MGRGGDNRNKIKTGGASVVIGKTIGVNRNYVQMGTWLIDNATTKIIDQLERGVLSIDTAYKIMNNRDKKINNKNRPTLARLLKYFEDDPEKKILLQSMIGEFNEGIRN